VEKSAGGYTPAVLCKSMEALEKKGDSLQKWAEESSKSAEGIETKGDAVSGRTSERKLLRNRVLLMA